MRLVGARWTAATPCTDWVRLASRRMAGPVAFHCQDLQAPLAWSHDGEFDVAVMALVIHHLDDRVAALPGWPPAPCCSYGATKAFDEALARAYDYQTDMSLIGLRLGLCTPEASPAEAVAGWLRPADLHRVVLGALDTDVKFGVYHAVSWPGRRRWNIEATIDELGYQPEHQDVREPADAAPTTCPNPGRALA